MGFVRRAATRPFDAPLGNNQVGGRCRFGRFSQGLAHPYRWGPPPKRHRPPGQCRRIGAPLQPLL